MSLLLDKDTTIFSPVRSVPHQSITFGTGVYNLWVPKEANKVRLQALAQNVRYTLDGTNPSAASGFQLKAGDAPIIIDLTATTVLKFFREASGAYLEVDFGL